MKLLRLFWPIFLLFIIIRLIFIFIFPPFCDESIYILWGKGMLEQNGLFWASLARWGKQPLPFWLFGLGTYLYPNPLIGARIIVLILNIPTFWAVYYLTKSILSEKAGKIALIILSLCPLFIFFQSLALMESFLLPLTFLIIWLLILIWQNPILKYLIYLGISLGLVQWIKFTALPFLAFIFFSLLYFYKSKKTTYFPIAYLLIPFLIAFIILLPILAQPDVGNVFTESRRYSIPIDELVKFPFSIWIDNFINLILSGLIYLTPGVFICIFLGHKKIERKYFWFFILFFLSFTTPIVFNNKILHYRYFLPGIIALLPLSVAGYFYLKPFFQKIFWLTLILITLFFLFFTPNYFYLFSPIPASLERNYALSWPSGYGIKEAALYLNELRSSGQRQIIALPNIDGNPKDYFALLYQNNPQINLMVVPITSKKDFEQVKPYAEKYSILFVTRESLNIPEIMPYLKLVKKFDKPFNEDFVGIYEIKF